MLHSGRKKTIILALFGSLLASSCEFTPNVIYHRKLDPPGARPDVTFDVNLPGDTVNFYFPAIVKLRYLECRPGIINVRYILDGKTGYVSMNDSVWYVSVGFNGTGIHKFKILITTHSGTGSLADDSNQEVFEYETREWTLVGCMVYPEQNLTSKTLSDGLELSWPKYDGIDFRYYRLKETGKGSVVNIYDESYKYTGFAGQHCSFWLYVVDREGVENLWGKCQTAISLSL